MGSHRILFILTTLILILEMGYVEAEDFPVLKGQYLGQKPPGVEPKMFAPGFISTGLSEAVCCFSPDGKEVYWNIAYSMKKDAKSLIVYSRIENGQWSRPEFVSFTNMEYIYVYPFLSYDGKELYFISNEPTGSENLKDEYNIWIVRRNGDKWGVPVVLPYPVNGRGITSGPSVTTSGVLYYTLITEKEQAIYRSRYVDGIYSEPERLPDAVNSTDNQFDGVIAPDESYMLLPVYNKSDSYGAADLYVTFRDNHDNWTPVVNLGNKINTKRVESAARISPDGKYIFLTGLYITHNWGDESLSYSDILNYFTKPGYGKADIYWISSKIIEPYKPTYLK
ncbi:MAG: TolB family protein [Planctomycetota bacterium]